MMDFETSRTGRIPVVRTNESLTTPLVETLGMVVVTLLSGLQTTPISPRSTRPRLAASGTIGHLLEGPGAVIWGSGCAAGPIPASVRPAVTATRGPMSWARLAGDTKDAQVHGDPIWLLPAFINNRPRERWRVGITTDDPSAFGEPPPTDAGVRLICTRTDSDPRSVRAVLDEILSCGIILAASLSGAVIAEAFGIPTACLLSREGVSGPCRLSTGDDSELGFEMADFYAGLRLASVPALFHQPDAGAVDWEKAATSATAGWNPAWLRTDDLLARFPLPYRPLSIPPGTDPFALDILRPAIVPDEPSPRPMTTSSASGMRTRSDDDEPVPLSWAATSSVAPYPNLGDALSATLVSVMSGRKIVRRHFDDRGERMAAVGTIAHTLRNGTVHMWGTGLDPKRNAFDPSVRRFIAPPATTLIPHAMRGRYSASRLRALGITAPPIYGDPVWFLPKLVGGVAVTPRYELGVILHITELTAPRPDAGPLPEFRRYQIPPSLSGVIRIINTYTENDTASLLARVDEIRSCRRIASTSFHGLVIPETFGIPNVWFSTHGGDGLMLDVNDDDAPLDHRIRDWYSGASRRHAAAFGTERRLMTPWDRLIRYIDQVWEPLRPDARALFDAFPVPPAVRFDDPVWPIDPVFMKEMRY